jgi:hypothetical protein
MLEGFASLMLQVAEGSQVILSQRSAIDQAQVGMSYVVGSLLPGSQEVTDNEKALLTRHTYFMLQGRD